MAAARAALERSTYKLAQDVAKQDRGDVLLEIDGWQSSETELRARLFRDLGALTITLKCELDNPAALRVYEAAGFEELSRRGGMATMRKDLD